MTHRLTSSTWLAYLAVVVALACSCSAASAQGFDPISPDELKMTDEPKAPGAPAIILYREVAVDDNGMTSHEDNYLRIKILTEEGRKYGDVEIAFNKATEKIVNIRARTVHADGSVIPFDGKVLDSDIFKAESLTYLAKTFSLPDVQVGSVVEYRYTIDLKENRIFNSHWILSSNLFTRTARFSLKPYVSRTTPVTLRWTWQGVPQGLRPQEGPDHVLRMQVNDIPAFQPEDFMPPPNELKSRVDFIYEHEYHEDNPDQYWQHVDRNRNEALEKFIGKPKMMQQAVAQIVSDRDSAEEKLRKVYARVQQIRNTSFETRKTAQEEKRDKEKPDENVEDVWKSGYGNHWQLNWLFLALARAAGFDAHGVLVSSRRDYFFAPKTMEYWKLNTPIVQITLNGKDSYFDPGAEFNSYGMLTWSETGTAGLRLDKEGGQWIRTTLPDSSESRVEHTAKLRLMESGELVGTVSVRYTGLEAMYHRLDVRNADDITRKRYLEQRITSQIPAAAKIELTSDPDWSSSDTPLTADFKITVPAWTTTAGKHTLIPAGFFTAGEKHVFEHANRTHPIYHHYPYEKEDDVTIELPPGWQVGGLPAAQDRNARVLTYSLRVEADKTELHLTRKFTVNFMILDSKYYPVLRDFYQSVRSGDEQQILLDPATAASN